MNENHYQVKEYRLNNQLVFGITNGKLWFAYAYSRKEYAHAVLQNMVGKPVNVLKLNVSYPAPLSVAK